MRRKGDGPELGSGCVVVVQRELFGLAVDADGAEELEPGDGLELSRDQT